MASEQSEGGLPHGGFFGWVEGAGGVGSERIHPRQDERVYCIHHKGVKGRTAKERLSTTRWRFGAMVTGQSEGGWGAMEWSLFGVILGTVPGCNRSVGPLAILRWVAS